MIDADADSVLVAAGLGTALGAGGIPVGVPPGSADAKPAGWWGAKRFLQLLGAAAILALIVTLIAVKVHNSGGSKQPAPTTAVTEPSTVASTSTTSSTSSTTSTSTSTSSPSTTLAGTGASGP
jgi:hypothetical protein